MNEETLVAKITSAFPSRVSKERKSQVKLGMGDDAALFRPEPGCDTVLTCDWFLEGSHFVRTPNSAESAGWKALSRAVSDIAAMGAHPRCFLLSLALPSSATGSWMPMFLKGLSRAAKKYRCPLAGGDTTQRKEILINITVIGEVRRGLALLRSGAKPGDQVFVSGRLGEAERGLRLVGAGQGKRADHDSSLRRHLRPETRLALGQWLSTNKVATAAMDLSDGLSTDLARLCKASRVGARLDESGILAAAVRDAALLPAERLQLALHGGEDYELLFTVPRKEVSRLPRTFQGAKLTRIGEITGGNRVILTGPNTESFLKPQGWDPFVRPASL